MALFRTLGCAICEWNDPKTGFGRHPTVRLNAEDAQVDRVALRRDDAVFADHTILLSARQDFARQQKQRMFRIVH